MSDFRVDLKWRLKYACYSESEHQIWSFYNIPFLIAHPYTALWVTFMTRCFFALAELLAKTPFISVYGFRSGTDSLSLGLLKLLFLLGRPLQKSLVLRRFELGRGEIWHEIECSLSKYASIDDVWRSLIFDLMYTFKMAATASFHAEECCHLVNEIEASAALIHSSGRQFLIYRVVPKKRYPSFNFAITSVNVHRF